MEPGILSVPAPAPFLVADQTPRGRWRRLAATLILGLLAGLAAATAAILLVFLVAVPVLNAASQGHVGMLDAVGVLVDSARPGRSLASYSFELAAAGVSSYAAAIAFLAVAARVERRPIRSFLTIAPRFRWRQVGLGLAMFFPLIGLAIWIASLVTPGTSAAPLLTPGASLASKGLYLAAAAFFLYLAALAEEMLFRGWALQQTGVFTRRLPVLLLINGVLFSLAHFDPDLAAFLSRAIMGMAWTWIVLRLGGVELAAGAHLANNLAICLFVRPVLFTPPAREPFDIASVALEAGTVAILVIAVEAALRRWPGLAAGRPTTS